MMFNDLDMNNKWHRRMLFGITAILGLIVLPIVIVLSPLLALVYSVGWTVEVITRWQAKENRNADN